MSNLILVDGLILDPDKDNTKLIAKYKLLVSKKRAGIIKDTEEAFYNKLFRLDDSQKLHDAQKLG